MKKILTFIFVCSFFASSLIVSAFTDVSSSTDYSGSINWMSDNLVINGYGDGTFGPDNCVTRGEILKMLMGMLVVDVDSYSAQAFTDTPSGEWFTPYAIAARSRGTVVGYEDGSFKPNQCVLRSEAVKMAVEEFGFSTDFDGLIPVYADVDSDDWFGEYILPSVQKNLLGTLHETTVESSNSIKFDYFLPYDSMSRKEVAEMLYRMKTVKDWNLEFDTFDDEYEPLEIDSEDLLVSGIERIADTVSSVNGPEPSYSGAAGLTDHSAVSEGSLGYSSLPGKGVVIKDPIFGTEFLRATDAADRGDYALHDYSQLQAFSPNSKYFLVNEDAGYIVKYVDGLNDKVVLDESLFVVRWDPSRDSTIASFSNGDGSVDFVRYNVETDEETKIYDFPSNYDTISVNRSSEEISKNGDWVAGLGYSANDEHIFAVNLATGTMTVELVVEDLFNGPCDQDPEYGAFEPDWVGISPLGNYLMVQWARDGFERCSGLELYDANSGDFVTWVMDGHPHGDKGVRDGREYFATSVNETTVGDDVTDQPAIVEFVLPLPGNDEVVMNHVKSIPWHGLWHISCQGPDGVCLVTSYYPEADWDPRYPGVFDDELWLVWLEDGSYRRIGHHRSSGETYWVQPRATWSQDGNYVLWDSDFWKETGDYINADGGEVWMMYLSDDDIVNPNNAGPFTK
jgi:hypothetical protein